MRFFAVRKVKEMNAQEKELRMNKAEMHTGKYINCVNRENLAYTTNSKIAESFII